MPAVALLMLQVASAVGPSAPSATPAGSLIRPVPSQTCSTKADEIIVCGKDADAYRLPKGVAQGPEGGLPKAEWKIFGDAQMSLHGTERNVAPGVSVPAAMVTIKVPF